jgi:hypothetical protein
MAIKTRLKRLRGMQAIGRDCEVCGAPSFRRKEIKVTIILDEAVPGKVREPDPMCTGCGRVMEPIRVKGMDDMARGKYE